MNQPEPILLQNPLNKKILRTMGIITIAGMIVALAICLIAQNLFPMIMVGLLYLSADMIYLYREFKSKPNAVAVGDNGFTFYYHNGKSLTRTWNQINWLRIADNPKADYATMIGFGPKDNWTTMTKEIGDEILNRYVRAMGRNPPSMKEYNRSQSLLKI
jgi:hypothetical protein